jgi:hypothetical protein
VAGPFKVGDRVAWNSEAGRVTGTIRRIHSKGFVWKGYVRHASKDDPQYEIKSDKTDHIAVHKGAALRKAGKASRSSAPACRAGRQGS